MANEITGSAPALRAPDQGPLLALVVLDHRLHLLFHRFEIERSRFLHRRIILSPCVLSLLSAWARDYAGSAEQPTV